MTKRGRILVGVLAGLALGFVIGLLASGMAAVVVISALVGGVAGALVALAVSGRQTSRDVPAEPGKAAGPDVPALMRQLVGLNLEARTRAFPPDVLGAVEETIDLLRKLVPAVNADHGSSSLAWEINRACTDYLPQIVHAYGRVDPTRREEVSAETLESLDALRSALRRAEEAIETRNADALSVSAKFLRVRFSAET